MGLRIGGRRAVLVIRFDESIEWAAFGVLELRRFYAVIGRHLRELEARQVARVLGVEELGEDEEEPL